MPSTTQNSFRPGFARVFGAYARRLLASRFHAVRLERESAPVLESLGTLRAPAIIAMSHVGWWDPIVGLFLARRFFPARPACAPMDAEQLRTFALLRRLGMFGVGPGDRHALRAVRDHVRAAFAGEPTTTAWINPQGRLSDSREPVRIRPGVAVLAADAARAHPDARVVALAVEYAFWADQRPEILVRAREVPWPERSKRGGPGAGADADPSPSTTAWFRAVEGAMCDNAAALAQLVVARDAAPFETLLGGRARINPVYDAWLRLRGRSNSIDGGRA